MNANAPMTSSPPDHLSFRGMITQTLAMVLDAYRELNAKKLFWITIILSGLLVAVFGGVGFNDRGVTVFGMSFPTRVFNTRFLPLEQLYKEIFIAGVQWWLAWFAIGLALISTAPIIPDFLGGGAIDLFLARPLSRARLFLTKYVVGLLFVAIQVAVFCLASFVVIGFRAGSWVPGVFLAVPVVVLIFSYLWSICALVGVLTRSTIAALLLTLLSWLAVFGLHLTESLLLTFSIGTRIEAQALERDVSRLESRKAALLREAATQPTGDAAATIRRLDAQINFTRASHANADDPFVFWHRVFYVAYWPLPKTAETTALMERWLDHQFRPPEEWKRHDDEGSDEPKSRGFLSDPEVHQQTLREVNRELTSRSAAWVIGTSLGFEGLMLLVATWTFARRDF